MDDTAIARVCHEANRVLQAFTSDPGIPVAAPWDEFPADQQAGVIAGVQHARNGLPPELLHEMWCREKRAVGWRYGPVKDTEAQLHPCLVEFDQLPADQQVKDQLFAAIVAAITEES